MTSKFLPLDETLHRYLLDVSLREPKPLAALRELTQTHERAQMQTAPEQTQFLMLLAHLIGARRVVEVGVFTGYTTLALALALPSGGRVIGCDVSAEFAAIGQPFWREAGVADKIELKIGPAADTLAAMLADGQAATVDLVYVDADKANYDRYYEAALKLVRPGGLIALDNVLWSGAVARPASDPDTVALQRLNLKLHRDERIELSVLPIGDGLTLARVKEWRQDD